VGIGLNERDLGGLTGLSEVRTRLAPALQYEQISFNQADPNPATGASPPWAGDPVVLEALDLALDRPALLRGPLHGRSPAAASPLSPLIPWLHATAAQPRHDPEAARRLLDGDGWAPGSDGVRSRGGRRLGFVLSTTTAHPLRAQEEEIIVRSWRQLGVDVRVQNFPVDQLFAGYEAGGVLARGRYEAALWAWITPPDPDAEFGVLHSSRVPAAGDRGSGENYSRCHDAALDAALTEGRSTLDETRRVAAYRKFQGAYARARCELPLYQRLEIGVLSPHLHNFVLNPAPVGSTWNFADWWLDG